MRTPNTDGDARASESGLLDTVRKYVTTGLAGLALAAMPSFVAPNIAYAQEAPDREVPAQEDTDEPQHPDVPDESDDIEEFVELDEQESEDTTTFDRRVHSEHLWARSHKPSIFESGIELQFPRSMSYAQFGGRYNPQSRVFGGDVTFQSPYGGLFMRSETGEANRTQFDRITLDGNLAIQRPRYDIVLFGNYNDSVLKSERFLNSTTLDEQGITTITNTSDETDIEERTMAMGIDARRDFGVTGLRVNGYAMRRKRLDEATSATSGSFSGDVEIDVPGVGTITQPVSGNFSNNSRSQTRQETDFLFAAFQGRINEVLPSLFNEAWVGPYTSLADVQIRSRLDGQEILDTRQIRRGYGIAALADMGDLNNNGFRAILAGHAGVDTVSEESRFTGQGVLAISTEFGFHPDHFWTMALSGSGRAGGQRYTLALASLNHDIGSSYSDDDENYPNNQLMNPFERLYTLENVLIRRATINSGFDERFSLLRRRELHMNTYRDLLQIGAFYMEGGFEKLSENAQDRIVGSVLLSSRYWFPEGPALGLVLDGYYGSSGNKDDFTRVNDRDWGFGIRAQYLITYNNQTQGLAARPEEQFGFLELGFDRIGTPSGIEGVVTFSIGFEFGYGRPSYDHTLYEQERARLADMD